VSLKARSYSWYIFDPANVLIKVFSIVVVV
jgi:hypothetical protein